MTDTTVYEEYPHKITKRADGSHVVVTEIDGKEPQTETFDRDLTLEQILERLNGYDYTTEMDRKHI